ncbi:hydrolase, partial [Streptomyces sp. SID5998]|nr:hydrolase [Streptomyces sp. SID5998]
MRTQSRTAPPRPRPPRSRPRRLLGALVALGLVLVALSAVRPAPATEIGRAS